MASRVAGRDRRLCASCRKRLGRLFPDGWRCEECRPGVPAPDPTRTAAALTRAQALANVTRAVAAAWRAGCTGPELSEALAAAERPGE